MAKSKSGTFIGDGTKAVDLQIGFEPDVIVINSGLDTAVAGDIGLYVVCLVKNSFTMNLTHNSNTDTQTRVIVGDLLNKGWSNSSLGAYRNKAEFNSGVLTITNVTNTPSAQYCFISGHTYTWTAYKA